MSLLQCHDCERYIDAKENPETYREELDVWICDSCWDNARCPECHADWEDYSRYPAGTVFAAGGTEVVEHCERCGYTS